MNGTLILAFFIGLLGSIHCVGMCGPLMFSMPSPSGSSLKGLKRLLLYQFGRLLTYGLLGLVLGAIGAGSYVHGWQQYLSMFTGIFLIGMAVYHIFGRYVSFIARRQQQLFLPLLQKMSYWIQQPGGHFMVGLLNGLLPCGMVYMALATALNTSTPADGFLFMLMFGAGTLPLLLTAGFIGNFFKGFMKFNRSRWLQLLFFVLGIWFILRGADLGIPYLSPLSAPQRGDILCR
ncbi:sulfite exporter TauE/SafE family protein [Olivibacter sp. SDN3]|uniref:sulfite exporter TauE/SafE family protein n=1 Tax=Olivibacter sp. SDN3 TaxID=2764720 RepID=UPI0016510EC8|nr:sulfite exporter TauE/SafE family protein [Olivibacter sp. SDN3]QNL48699.1 sulfite exporter TauE/SafE family protein [Olivibacter sp. SDN3]